MKHLLLIACFAVAASGAAAGEDCTCRAPGLDVPEGETVCLTTASGPQLARCERVLNNTSWTFLGTPCPSANLSPPTSAPASIAASAAQGPAILR